MQKAVYLLLFLIAGTIAIAQVSSKSPVNTDAAVSPLVNRNGRIIGMWRPHPTIADTWWPDKEGRLTQEQLGLPKSNPHADHWRLSFNADGTAAFTGKEFYLGSDPPQTADAEMTTDD